MGAFRKFDPRAFRETHLPLSPAAKPAKVAKPSWPERRFSSFSNFSRGISPTRDSWTPADWLTYFDERAAIREHMGRIAREIAEPLAFDDTVAHWLSAHPHSATPPDRCVHCGQPQRHKDVLLPMLAEGGHTWIHNGCWSEWYSARRREAVASLRAAGVPSPSDPNDPPEVARLRKLDLKFKS